MLSDLLKRIAERRLSVGIIGLGYVGLPLALRLAEQGLEVTGIDLDPGRVDALNRGRSPFSDLPSSRLEAAVKSGHFRATCNHGVLASLDAVVVDVPTPLGKTREPDVSLVMTALSQMMQHVHHGQLIVVESTTWPGFTREIVLPMLTSAGLHVGKDVFLVFSPERIDPGNDTYGVSNTPKIVGGATATCAEVGKAFYSLVTKTVRVVSSLDAAEMGKLHENTFRAVNIALANETLIMARRLGLDPWEIIDAAATKPFGFMPFYPGPGLGGHCIPVDPIYLSWKLKSLNYSVRFIELADAVNTNMPEYVITRLMELLNERGRCLKGSRILVMGVAYKPDVGDMRESPALRVLELLAEKGAVVQYHDPHVPTIVLESGHRMASVDFLTQAPASDCCVIVTDHKAVDYAALASLAPLIFDTRGVTRHQPALPNTVRI